MEFWLSKEKRNGEIDLENKDEKDVILLNR